MGGGRARAEAETDGDLWEEGGPALKPKSIETCGRREGPH